MRLKEYELKAIKNTFTSVFKEGRIYLFGSRVDDRSSGGDIDLYIDVDKTADLREKKLKFLIDLKSKIGDQKIDVIISRDKSRIIEQEALKKGVAL
jgi:predicted nucleotidyltransferase